MAPNLVANYAEAREVLVAIIVNECDRRMAEVYHRMRIFHDDDEETRELKKTYCITQLHHYADNPLDFIKDFGWAPDPKGLFGGRGKMPEGLAPAGMVPLMLSPAQEQFLQEIVDAMLSEDDSHINLLKSRQLACTTMVLCLFIWALLFQPGITIGICSYDEAQIDPGGSGHRTADALFPRMRMMFDAIAKMVPELAFNQHRAEKWKQGQRDDDNHCLFTPSQDSRFKIQRPKWTVYKRHMFKRAEKNYIRGAAPSERFLQGDICTVILLDEFGLFKKPVGIDAATRDSVLQSCSCIISQGTIPKGGGLDSHFKSLYDQGNTNSTLLNIELDWSDVEAYMLFSHFKCPHCKKRSRYGTPQPGPGPTGIDKMCTACGQQVHVHRFTVQSIPTSESTAFYSLQPGEVSSDWWVKRMASNNFNRISISRFYLRDWMASVGDRAFYTFDSVHSICARTPETPEQRWYSIDGFDPGWNEANPAAWVLVRFSDEILIPRIVAWHMAPDRVVEWWVPFFNRWPPSTLHRKVIQYGAYAGMNKLWTDVHHYTSEELDILARISAYPRRRGDEVEGDKYGSHKSGVGISEYQILSKYGIDVRWEYTKDRESLIGEVRDLWVPRLEIDPEVASYRPDAKSSLYPSIVDCFSSARMRTTLSGQGEPKRDIDKNNPKHVSHPIDAFLYACRSMPDEIHAVSDLAGEFSVEGVREPEAVFFGERFEGQFG